MGNAILYRMPSGIPGDISRQQSATVESIPGDSSAAFSAYGLIGKIASGKFVPFAGSEAASAAYGILVRPYPTTGGTSDPLGTSTPPSSGILNVLKRGYITVKNNAGTPALNGTVYVRVANAASGKPIGGFEAASDSTNTVAIAGAYFTGPADASGNVEIAYNI